MDKVIQFIGSVKNRDAVLRFVQFATRVVANILKNVRANPALQATLGRLAAALVNGRKAFAFGNMLSEGKNALGLVEKAKGDASAAKVLPAVRSAAMTSFWLFDHLGFLAGPARVIPGDAQAFSLATARVWFVAVCCSLYLEGTNGCRLGKAIKTATAESAAEEDVAELRKKRCLSLVRQTRNVCDLFVSANNARFIRGNPLLVNLAGALSAAIFIYDSFTASK